MHHSLNFWSEQVTPDISNGKVIANVNYQSVDRPTDDQLWRW
jgi:hypothetical protein